MKFFDKGFLFASFSAYGVFIVSLTCALFLYELLFAEYFSERTRV